MLLVGTSTKMGLKVYDVTGQPVAVIMSCVFVEEMFDVKPRRERQLIDSPHDHRPQDSGSQM
jgi:hypothetical protein